jgi:hypothetical protein
MARECAYLLIVSSISAFVATFVIDHCWPRLCADTVPDIQPGTYHTPQTTKAEGDLRSRVELAPGSLAPKLDLMSADGRSEFHLDAYRGQEPVVLLFGSFT